MGTKIDERISVLIILIAVFYILLITDALGKIGIMFSSITYNTFRGVDAMFIAFLLIAAALLYYFSKKK